MVVVVGFMGAGKTTVGTLLARRLARPFRDSDIVINERLGATAAEVFATKGEAFFRDVEHETIAELLTGPDLVLSVGGGAIEDARTRALLTGVSVVYLHVSYEVALARLPDDGARPMLARPDLAAVYERRLPLYRSVSTLTIETDGRSTAAITTDIEAQLVG